MSEANRREGKVNQGAKQKADNPWDPSHYKDTQLTYIGAVAHAVAEDAEGYEDYAGRLLHWHIVAGWTETTLGAGGSLPENLADTPAYHFDTAKPYLGRHQIDIYIDKKPYHIPHDSPKGGHIFWTIPKDKKNKSISASQIEGNIIKQHCLHNYEYNGEFSGCLCWTRTLITRLAKDGIIDASAPQQFEKIVTTLRNKKLTSEMTLYEIPHDDGKFFKKGKGGEFDDFDPLA